MAKTWVIVVGHSPTDLNVGLDDNLILAFANEYKFCVTSGDPDDFDPPLPTGQDFNAGEVWPANGNVAVAKSTGTIGWDHLNKGASCEPAKLGGGHSIIIGG